MRLRDAINKTFKVVSEDDYQKLKKELENKLELERRKKRKVWISVWDRMYQKRL